MTTAFKFKKVRNVTLPLLKLVENHAVYVRMDSAMFEGKQIDDKKEPATLINVTNLETGEECQIIAPTVLKGILTDDYPNDGYVGKSFSLVMHKVMDKADPNKLKYNKFDVAEIEVVGEETAPAAAEAAPKAKK